MKTVTVKGKVYQLGALYRDADGEIGRLKKVSLITPCYSTLNIKW